MVRKTRTSQRTTRSRRTGLPCATRGHYPRLAVPVQRDCTRSPVMMPSGRVLPKPPGSQGDEPRPAGTALAPPDGVTRPASWYVGEIGALYRIWGRAVNRRSLYRRPSRPPPGAAIDRPTNGPGCGPISLPRARWFCGAVLVGLRGTGGGRGPACGVWTQTEIIQRALKVGERSNMLR